MVTPNKLIQIPVDAELLAKLDELSKAEGTSRSAIIRRACRDYLRRMREEALDQLYQRGYEQIPEDTGVGEVQVVLAPQVLPEESW